MTDRGQAELLIEGRVASLAGDAGFGWVEALAVGDGRVLAAGSRAEVEALSGPGTRRWRLGPDMLAMPGVTDAHLHLMMLVLAERQVDLSAARDLDSTLALIADAHRSRAAAGDEAGWLLGHGWALHTLGRWPEAEMLDQAAPGRPIALYAHDHHSRWLSSAALSAARIERVTPDADGGLVRRNPDGRPSGVLHEAACGLLDAVIPEPRSDELESDLAGLARRLLAMGITGCHDPGELSAERSVSRGPVFYRSLAARGQLPLRVHASVRAPQLEHAIEIGLRSGQEVAAESADPLAARCAARYRMGWLKLFADGSLGSRSAALLEPYEDAAANPPTGGPRGMMLTEPDELAADLWRAAGAGISGQVHAIGDAAVRLALDLLAQLPATSLMRRVEHAQLVHPDDVARFGRLGVAASVQPVHLRSDAAPARAAWGARAENAFPLAGLAAAGALIPFGTDAPVEPPEPWPGLAVAIARRDPDSATDAPLGGRHALDLARAVRAACLDPALVAGQADLGRLLPGYRADLLVVPSAAFREPIDAGLLAHTRPVATMIDGEVVHGEPDWA